jgi:hypothetical protein
MGGNPGKHDELVGRALTDLSTQVDVIVLAQASMARVVESLPAEVRRIPILASPPLAVEHVAQVFAARQQQEQLA